MTTLENLYYGNIDLANKYIKRGSEYSKLINLSVRNEDKLVPTLSKEQKVIFEKYKDCLSEMNSIAEKGSIHPRHKTRNKNHRRILPHRLPKFQRDIKIAYEVITNLIGINSIILAMVKAY